MQHRFRATGSIIASAGIVVVCFAVIGLCADWPQFLGSGMNQVEGPSSVPLARTFPAGGPPVAWFMPNVGETFGAGIVVRDGRVYITEREMKKGVDSNVNFSKYATNFPGADIVRSLDFSTGAEYWRYTHPVNGSGNSMGLAAASTPTVDETRVFVTGPQGWIYCLDKHTGREIWKRDLAEEYGIWIYSWNYTASPVMYKDLIVLTIPGGLQASVVALDKATGTTRWTTPPLPPNYATPYESVYGTTPAPAHFGGVDQFIMIHMRRSVFSVDANTGKCLWSVPATFQWLECNPLILEDSHQVLLSEWHWPALGGLPRKGAKGDLADFIAGGGDPHYSNNFRIAVERGTNGFTAKRLNIPENGHIGLYYPPVRYQGHAYCFKSPGAHGKDIATVACLDLATWKTNWTIMNLKFEGVPILTHDGTIYVVGKNLSIVTPTADHFEPLYNGLLKDGGALSAPALVDGYLLVHNDKNTTCYDVSEPARFSRPARASTTANGTTDNLAGLGAVELCNRLSASLLADRTNAMNTLIQLSGTTAPALLQAAQSDDWPKQSSACAVLQRIGPPAKNVAPDLAILAQNAIKNREWALAGMALDALKAVDDSFARKVVADLAAALRDPDIETQRHALQMIAHLGAMAGAVVDPVLALHGGREHTLARSSIIALGYMTSATDKAVPALVSDLDQPDLKSYLALAALRLMGPPAKRATTEIQAKIAKGKNKTIDKLLEDTLLSLNPATTPTP